MKIKNIDVDWVYLPYKLSDVVLSVLFPFISYIIFLFFYHIYLYLNISYLNTDIYTAFYFIGCFFPLIYLVRGFVIGFIRQREDDIYGFCNGCYVTENGTTHFKQSNILCSDCELKDKK